MCNRHTWLSDRHGNLATVVSGMEMVAGNGDVIVLSREQDHEQFQGAVVALGGLGVVTKLTRDISPTFEMRQDVYENLPLAEWEVHFDELFSSAYSVSLFTDWRNATFNQVWLKRRVPDGNAMELEPQLFGATLAAFNARPDWAKLFTMTPARVQSLYEKLPDFQGLLQYYDPQGKLRNAFLDKYIWG